MPYGFIRVIKLSPSFLPFSGFIPLIAVLTERLSKDWILQNLSSLLLEQKKRERTKGFGPCQKDRLHVRTGVTVLEGTIRVELSHVLCILVLGILQIH